jgi:hypothetical protein
VWLVSGEPYMVQGSQQIGLILQKLKLDSNDCDLLVLWLVHGELHGGSGLAKTGFMLP